MKNIIAALVDVQTSAEAPKKNAANPHFKSKFADLAQILSVLRAPLMANGLAVVQSPSVRDDGKSVCVQTTIYHSSGEVLDCGVLAMPVERPGPQAVGSAITYARRYALQAIFCLAAEDDDGESAELRDGKAQGKPARGLDDVAATKASPAPKPTPVDVNADPRMPKCPPPTVPAGQYAGRTVDTLPIAYLRDTLPNVKIPENRAWFEYLIAMADQEI
jgi:hypothetical protein